MKTTLSRKNFKKPAPKVFIAIKVAVYVLTTGGVLAGVLTKNGVDATLVTTAVGGVVALGEALTKFLGTEDCTSKEE